MFNSSLLFWPSVNALGSALIPVVNALCNWLLLLPYSDFPHYDPALQRAGSGLYPGAGRCNSDPTAPHAKWHLQSAVGLVDLVHLADLLHRHLSRAEKESDSEGHQEGATAATATASTFFRTELSVVGALVLWNNGLLKSHMIIA